MDDISTIYQAIAAFSSTDSTACGNASVWLNEFQKSVHAWSVCDRILREHKDQFACYFAAQTMRQKLVYSMRELPPSSHLSLKEALLNHLRFSIPEKLPVLLMLLKTLPEEVQSDYLRIGQNRRQAVNAELAEKTPAVIQYLSGVCASTAVNQSLLKQMLSCFASWLLNPMIPTDEIASSGLLQCVFNILHNVSSPSNLFDVASECVVSALCRAEDSRKHHLLAITLQPACYAMAESFSMAVANDDCDKLHNYARIFCELNESFLEDMVSTPGEGLGDFRNLEMLLLIAGYHDYNLVELTFNIWYRLSECMYERNDDNLNEKFRPYIERYIMALYKHCRFDSDLESVPDENDEFLNFRIQVSDTIKDVVFIVGTDRCVQSMLQIIQSVSSGSWDESEAALYIISIVVHSVLPTNENVVPELVQAVLRLPMNVHPILTLTSINLLGNLVDWLFENTDYQGPCMDWLFDKLQKPIFVTAATNSIENMCEKCQHKLVGYFEQLMTFIPVLENCTGKGENLERAVSSLLRSCSSVLNGLPGNDIAARLRILVEPQAQRLDALLKSATDDFATCGVVNDENRNDSWSRLSHDPVLWIDRISSIFRQIHSWNLQPANPKNSIQNGSNTSFDVPEVWLDVVRAVMPIISNANLKYQSSTHVVEHCCRAIRFMIRSLGVQSIIFIKPLVEQMINIYTRHPHSCFLYLSSILVDEYGQIEDCRLGLVSMLNILSMESFKILQQENGFCNHPDTIDDLFRLGIRFVQRAPSVFFTEPISVQLFECSMAALAVDHVDANRSVTKFIMECITSVLAARKSNYRDAGVDGAERLLARFGDQLVSCILRSAVFSVSGTLKRDMAELLSSVGKLSKSDLSIWLQNTLNQFPHNGGLCATKEQLQMFHKNVLEATDVRQVHGHIRDLIRLYT